MTREHHTICIPVDLLTDAQRDDLYAVIADIAEQIDNAITSIEIAEHCDCE